MSSHNLVRSWESLHKKFSIGSHYNMKNPIKVLLSGDFYRIIFHINWLYQSAIS